MEALPPPWVPACRGGGRTGSPFPSPGARTSEMRVCHLHRVVVHSWSLQRGRTSQLCGTLRVAGVGTRGPCFLVSQRLALVASLQQDPSARVSSPWGGFFLWSVPRFIRSCKFPVHPALGSEGGTDRGFGALGSMSCPSLAPLHLLSIFCLACFGQIARHT